jgi:hypothetical protein
MAGTLIVWKAPRVDDEDAAARLLAEYYETGDESAFERSDDVAGFYDELVALYPPDKLGRGADEESAWAATPERSDRIVSVDYRWSASGAFLDDIERLARAYGLILYDPQGPTVVGPDEEGTDYVPATREVVRVTLILMGALVVAAAAWYASIVFVSWIVITVAGFMALMAVYTLYAYAREALQRRWS